MTRLCSVKDWEQHWFWGNYLGISVGQSIRDVNN